MLFLRPSPFYPSPFTCCVLVPNLLQKNIRPNSPVTFCEFFRLFRPTSRDLVGPTSTAICMIWQVDGIHFLGGDFIFLKNIFTPKIGEDEPILTFIFFKMGWFNHQLALWHFMPLKVDSNCIAFFRSTMFFGDGLEPSCNVWTESKYQLLLHGTFDW